MKFIYIDESGDRGQGDIFVMAGLMVDAYKLRKKTEAFDRKLSTLFALHPGDKEDLKTSRFINGKGGWGKVNPEQRKSFLRDFCTLAAESGGKIFCYPLSFSAFETATAAGYAQPFGNNHWMASSMFIACLVQKRMQKIKNNKGLTIIIVDDNKVEAPKLSEILHQPHQWFDGLYQIKMIKKGNSPG